MWLMEPTGGKEMAVRVVVERRRDRFMNGG